MACGPSSTPGRIYFGCCHGNIKMVGFVAEVCGFHGLLNGAPFNSGRLYRRATERVHFLTDAFPEVSRTMTWNVAPWTMRDGAAGGFCYSASEPVGAPVFEYVPNKALFDIFARQSQPSGTTSVNTETHFTHQAGTSVTEKRLEEPLTDEMLRGILRGLANQIAEHLPNMQGYDVGGPLDPRPEALSVRCNGILNRFTSSAFELGSHVISRAFMEISGVQNGDAVHGFRRCMWVNLYVPLQGGTTYCEVTRTGIDRERERQALRPIGGVQVGCERKTATGATLVIEPPECAFGSNVAVDFYTALSDFSPPSCCGMAP